MTNTLKHQMINVCFSKETDSSPKQCDCTNITFTFTDPFIKDGEDQQCMFTISIVSGVAYSYGRTTLKGTQASTYLQCSDQYDKVRHFDLKLQHDLESVIDMRSVHAHVETDTSFKATVNHSEKKTIRLWNTRTLQFIKLQVVLPEGVSFKNLQQSLSDWFNISGNCFGYLKIGEPRDC